MLQNITGRYPAALPDRIFFLSGLVMLCTEIAKQFILTFVLGAGKYNWWYFPFQLCSIPMYILLAWPWIRSCRIRRALLCFLMCYGLLGGIAVFADTSGLHYQLPVLTAHSYLWHIALILIGLCAGTVYHIRFRPEKLLPSFAGSTLLYLLCCMTAEILNLSLDRSGVINMFYINPDYPMQQVVFRDLSPVIGNLPCIFLYICATILGALLLRYTWELTFRFLFPLFPGVLSRLDILLRDP